MTPCPRHVLAAAVQVLLSMLAAQEIGAQTVTPFRLGSWAGSLEVGYQADRERSHSPDGVADIATELRQMSERLLIRNEGLYVFDPRLVRGNLGMTFGLQQERDSANGSTNSRNLKLHGYTFDAIVLAEKPISGGVFANRSQSFTSQPFGRTDSTFANRGATVSLSEDSFLKRRGIRYLRSNLRVEQQRIQEATTSVLGQGYRRDERRNIFTFDGLKGFDTADLDWRYEFNDLKDSINPQGSFRSHAASLNYSLDFGQRLNRRSDTHLSYSNRSGVFPTSIVTGDERVHIDHYTNLSTDYRYQLMQIDTQAGKTLSQIGSFQIQHELYRNLTSTAQTSATHTDLPTGKRDSYAGQVDFNYRRGLPWNGTVFVRTGGRNQVDDNHLSASQIDVTDESHAAPSPLGAGAGFVLGQPFAVASSLVVVDTRGGARLATALNIDYELVVEGNIVHVVPLITSAVIQPGDPLAVSYAYQVDPSIKYDTTAQWLSAGVDFRWISLSAGHEQSNQTLLAGQDSRFLQAMRKDTAQLDLRGAWKSFQGQAGAAYVRYESTRLAYTQQRYNQLVSYRPRSNLTLLLTADSTRTAFTLPQHQTDSRTLRLTMDWYGRGGWSATGLISRRVYADSSMPTETVNEASLRARLDYGKFSLVSAFTAADRARGGFQTNSWRVDMTATRRF
jgi:hypothetical protein